VTAPLHPGGTLRARFEGARSTDVFRRLGLGARRCDLGDEGLYLAEELIGADAGAGWLGTDEPEAIAVLVLALMVAQRQGSTRLPLDPKGPLRGLAGDIARVAGLPLDVPRLLKTIARLTNAPRFGSVLGAADARAPLIVDDGCLYTERSRWLEQRVADALAVRTRAPRNDASAVVADLAAHPGKRALSAEQARAVETALAGKLAVVTGGPGTGKTVVAAAIVRGLARLGVAPIALAAQTGKAANRLTEVIAAELASIGSSVAPASSTDRALVAAPPVAQTLHRLLGYRGARGNASSTDRFAHHAQSPLPVGALIIDEASMIDLELMHAVLDALPAHAPLILIGDAHQLPAIDAGQILADLVGSSAADASKRGGPAVAVLEHSYRMDADDPRGRAVLAAANAVHAGHAHRLADKAGLAAPRTPGTLTFSGVEWVDPSAGRPAEVALAVAGALWHHFDGPRALRAADRVFRFDAGACDPAQLPELERLWALLSRARILTVTRGLLTGSLAVNAALHDLALDRMSVSGRPEFVPGEPVMITANDYQRGLFNGDQGIIVRADEGLGGHRFRAVFRVAGRLTPFAIEALRDRLELSWALTVHKSQGSELDAIALLLPDDELPLVTRELLYTAITRARTGVAICGAKQLLDKGGKRCALRHSGLATRLAAALARTA
jgi:exodeoxyribonuclease V alpha subunit